MGRKVICEIGCLLMPVVPPVSMNWGRTSKTRERLKGVKGEGRGNLKNILGLRSHPGEKKKNQK